MLNSTKCVLKITTVQIAMNYQSPTFKLYRYQALIGTICDIGSDWPWLIGHIDLTAAFEPYKDEFRHLTIEENDNRFDYVTEEQMTNWYLEDTDGNKEQIYMPAIYEDDNSVWWRWGNPDELKDF